MFFPAVSPCCKPQARLPDRSPSYGSRALSGAVGVLLFMAVPGRGCQARLAPLVPPRQPGLCHTQSAYVRRCKAASKEPTKQKGRLLLPNIVSLCSVCLVGHPAARVQYSAPSLPCHISRRFAARPGGPCTAPGPRAQPGGGEGSLSPCGGQGGTWAYRQALRPSMF